jgi:hypothetical protein
MESTVPLGVRAAKKGNTCKEVKQLERGGTHFDFDSYDKTQGT